METSQGTPTVDTTVDTTATTPLTAPADEQGLRTLVSTLIKDEAGKPKDLVIPEGTDPSLALAIRAEASRRGTQAQHTKVAQDLALTKARLDATTSLATKGALGAFTADEISELEDLKANNLDAWRVRYNELETARQTRATETVTTALQVDPSVALEGSRTEQLTTFNSGLDKPLTAEELADELPPKLLKAVNAGTMSYEDYLTKAVGILRPDTAPEVTTSTVPNHTVPTVQVVSPNQADGYNVLDDDELTL